MGKLKNRNKINFLLGDYQTALRSTALKCGCLIRIHFPAAPLPGPVLPGAAWAFREHGVYMGGMKLDCPLDDHALS